MAQTGITTRLMLKSRIQNRIGFALALLIVYVCSSQMTLAKDKYTKLNHPVLGKIEIRTDTIESLNAQQLNKMLAEQAAKQITRENVNLSYRKILSGQFCREFTSSSRALQEKLIKLDPTTKYEDDFTSDVANITNPNIARLGRLAGSILDPITMLIPLTKLQKLVNTIHYDPQSY